MATLPDLPSETLTQTLSFVVNKYYQVQKLSFVCPLSTLPTVLPLATIKQVYISFERDPAKCTLFLCSLKEKPDLHTWSHTSRLIGDMPIKMSMKESMSCLQLCLV